MFDIEGQFKELSTILKSFAANRDARIAELESELREQSKALAELGRIPPADRGGDSFKAFADAFAQNKEGLTRHGRVSFEIPSLLGESKATIVSTGLTTPAQPTGLYGEGKWRYGRLRSLFRTIPTTAASIFVPRSTSESAVASPQVEGQGKHESAFTFTATSIPIQTIASFVHISRQALDDISAMGPFLESTLRWALEKRAEEEILAGDSTGVHLTGLIPTATAFDTTILPAVSGWHKVDVLAAAVTQLRESGFAPSFAVVHPRDAFHIRTQKDGEGQYLTNSPLQGIELVESPEISETTFLVGDASMAAIRQRMATTVAISYEHNQNFTSNLATILAEERFCITLLRPEGFISGSLSSSPISA
ncbi:MAG: phage major capsid protein [Bryobacteraceae bacterium]|nr:phage major capsid protein [Bryobacteraceae bacterium]